MNSRDRRKKAAKSKKPSPKQIKALAKKISDWAGGSPNPFSAKIPNWATNLAPTTLKGVERKIKELQNRQGTKVEVDFGLDSPIEIQISGEAYDKALKFYLALRDDLRGGK